MEKNKGERFMHQELNDQDIVKKTVIELHNKNKDDVPKYLDELKKEKNNIEKEATCDNEFLKYML